MEKPKTKLDDENGSSDVKRIQRHLQGCQIFPGTMYQHVRINQITAKYTKWPQIVSNGRQNRPNIHKKYYTTSSIARLFKMYPNWDFWSEYEPSDNPGHLAFLGTQLRQMLLRR
jgi:hypothetical protein